MNNIFKNKQFLGILFVIIAFAAITLIYFSPILEGKRIKQHDIEMYKGMSQEINQFREETGEQSLWTNSMFGGMPTWNIGVKQNSNLMNHINKILNLGFPHPIGSVFISMLGFFILLLVLDCKIWISFIGALAYGFTSYLFIVIGAGHNSKAVAMAYMAPVIAGIIMTYKGKYLWGAVLTAIALALEIRAGHIQITYYLFIIVLIYIIVELIDAVRNKRFNVFFKASSFLAVAAILAVLTSTIPLYANYEFGKETMRGKPVLTENSGNQTRGLDRDYVTQWSYGIGETWSLMIPNAKGGASAYIGNDNPALEKASPRFRSTIAQNNAYWGDQPGTSGPVYVGAIVCFLFVLGLFVVKGKIKWVLLIATILSILLSWGKNFMGFTDFFLDYFPMYNKFRAVSMTLVIAEVCMPILAFLALAEVIKNPEILKKNMYYFYISFGLTAGLCLLFYIIPDVFFNFLSQGEAAQFAQLSTGKDGAIYQSLATELEKVRMAIFQKDAIRSFLFITIAAIILLININGKLKNNAAFAILAALVIFDMFPINKRYLNNDNFIDKRRAEKPFVMSDIDKQILQDKELNYRVMDLTKNTFNDASTSYYHKSIGGYHGAKLRRYQDVIDHYLGGNKVGSNGFWNVLNMLNTKYLIYPQGNKPAANINPDAFGNAWIVSDIKWVATPNEEIAAIENTDVKKTAIINDEFKNVINEFKPSNSLGTIRLDSYKPNELIYSFNSSKDELVVFSEIWTSKGWTLWIDGKESPLIRADYILRAAVIPAGNHEIMMRYEPKIWKVGNTIQFISSLILILGLITAIVISIKAKRQQLIANSQQP
ncbi:MAG: YfhO family protein [Bacteroidales bacterium]|nr:YfhO family protein [Bacteroidales bacterium]